MHRRTSGSKQERVLSGFCHYHKCLPRGMEDRGVLVCMQLAGIINRHVVAVLFWTQ
jgi:hypothetical protein